MTKDGKSTEIKGTEESPKFGVSLGLMHIPIEYIERFEGQPRKFFDETKINELATSIFGKGLLESIALRKVGDERYVLILGERRWRAHKTPILEGQMYPHRDGKDTIKAEVYECTEAEAHSMSMVENLQREDLNLVEEAIGYSDSKEKYGYKLKHIAEMTGKSMSTISNVMGILKESKEIQELAASGKVSLAAYVWIKQLPNNSEKLNVIRMLNRDELAFKDLRDYIQKVVTAYRLGETIEGVSTAGMIERKRKGRTPMTDGMAFPKDFQYYYVSMGVLDQNLLNFLPKVNLLVPAYGLMHDKAVMRTTLKTIVNYRDKIDSFFCDSGGLPAVDRKDFKYFDHQDELIKFYETVKPEICCALDVPCYPKVFEAFEKELGQKIDKDMMLEKTFENARKFIEWEPGFKTIKVFVTQGRTLEDHKESLKRYKVMGVFEKVKSLGIAVGGQARSSSAVQQEIGKYVVEFCKEQREDIKMFHFFGCGSPRRIVALYKLGFTSFDSTSPDKASVYGDWIDSDGGKHKGLLDSGYRCAGPVRRLFNWMSLWIRLDLEFQGKTQETKEKDEQ